MRISDWSSDVCSSDLLRPQLDGGLGKLDAIASCRQHKIGKKDIYVVVITQYAQRFLAAGCRQFAISDAAPKLCSDIKHSSEKRRVGKDCVGACRSWCSPDP